MATYEKPFIHIVELDTKDGYLSIFDSSIDDDPQIDFDPTDNYN